ncbi:SAM-dependent methyltransferase [Cryptosporangium sp. NPDC048952]|uniref:SAM-dependent methyltransferase n=1 Tax=Cryptosporangium sp. NPDC048952 TaxID=3363961 RepID=UPI0037147B5B
MTDGGITVEAPQDDDGRRHVDQPHLERPSAARMYDYYLGGGHNFAVDREAAARVVEIYPNAALIAQANRAFLARAVKHLLAAGVRQFLDLGSGIPTAGNVHQVIDAVSPGARVVYVDIDPVAIAHSETILGGRTDVGVVHADVRHPDEVLDSPITRRLIDFDQPVGVLAVAVLHFVSPDDDPAGVLARYREAVAPGSYLALSHGTVDRRPENVAKVSGVYRNTRDPTTFRTREEVAQLLTGWELLEPGLVWLPQWRPDWPDEATEDPSWTEMVCAVGRKV